MTTDAPAVAPRPAETSRWALLAQPALLALTLGLLSRVWLIDKFPNNYSFDAWQRWAGRDHVLVQDWLPAVQAIIYVVAKLGGGVQVTRMVLATVTSIGTAAGVWAAESMGGRSAAWIFAVASMFGPFVLGGALMYQEGTFLAVFFIGLALALRAGVGLSAVRLRGRPAGLLFAADLCFGLLTLVRYEGWVVLVLYAAWRRDWRVSRAFWGLAVWGAVKAVGVKGYYPSPMDYFADWRGIEERFDLHDAVQETLNLGDLLLRSGGLGMLVLGLAAAGMCWRQRGIPLVTAVLLAQCGITLVWIVGLETATLRMSVLPVVLSVLPLSVAASEVWQRFPKLRPAMSAALIGWAVLGMYVAADQVARERWRVKAEVVAIGRMHACPECRWWVEPRRGFGPRDRHDGCEILQGMTRLRHGEEFWCAPWIEDLSAEEQAARQSQTDGTVRWSKDGNGAGRYVVEFKPE